LRRDPEEDIINSVCPQHVACFAER